MMNNQPQQKSVSTSRLSLFAVCLLAATTLVLAVFARDQAQRLSAVCDSIEGNLAESLASLADALERTDPEYYRALYGGVSGSLEDLGECPRSETERLGDYLLYRVLVFFTFDEAWGDQAVLSRASGDLLVVRDAMLHGQTQLAVDRLVLLVAALEDMGYIIP